MRHGSLVAVLALAVTIPLVTAMSGQAAGSTAALSPSRMLDTREGIGAPRGPLAAGDTLRLAVPASAAGNAAIAFNLTAVGAAGLGYVTAWPCDGAVPDTSNLNVAPNVVSANLVMVGTGDDDICLFASTTVHLIADLMGTFGDDDDLRPARPTRLSDTRVDRTRLTAGEVREIDVTTGDGFLSSAGGVALNVTIVGPAGDGYATVYPCGQRPHASTVNFRDGDVVPNFTFIPYRNGRVCVYSSAATDLVVDSFGWSTNGGDVRLATPTRVLDTRVGDGWTGGPADPSRTVVLRIAGIDGVPLDAQGVLLTLVATDATADGYVTIYPCDRKRPVASILNMRAGSIRANLAMVPLSDADGTVCLWAYTADGSSVGLVADVVGWTLGGPLRAPAPTTTTSTTTAPGPTTTITPSPGEPLTCGSVTAAFCEDFEGPRNTTGNRNGDLSTAKFSLARWRSEAQTDGANRVHLASVGSCRAGYSSELPPGDSLVCDPTASIASRHALVATASQNYGDNLYRINQPFDIAGRTGTFTFDASLDIDDFLVGFPLVVFTQDPMSAPSYYADNSKGPTPRSGVAVQFKYKCAADGGYSREAVVYEYVNHVENELTDQSGCDSLIQTAEGRLNRVKVRISQSRLEVWATDASADGVGFGQFELMYVTDLSLPFSRGYLYFGVHNHASEKYASVPSWSTRWDNLAFDGPVVAATKVSQVADAHVGSGASTELGYDLGATSTGALALPGVVVGANARLVFNTWIDVLSNQNYASFRVDYRLNGGTWRSASLSAAEISLLQQERSGSFSWSVPVATGDLQNGTNTIEFRGSGFFGGGTPTIGNIDLITW